MQVDDSVPQAQQRPWRRELPHSDNVATFASSTVFDTYKKLYGSDIEDSIEGETTGNLENLLLAVCTSSECLMHPVKHN